MPCLRLIIVEVITLNFCNTCCTITVDQDNFHQFFSPKNLHWQASQLTCFFACGCASYLFRLHNGLSENHLLIRISKDRSSRYDKDVTASCFEII